MSVKNYRTREKKEGEIFVNFETGKVEELLIDVKRVHILRNFIETFQFCKFGVNQDAPH